MIIGNGAIASALYESRVNNFSRLYFASGVSNSHELLESEYQREKDLLSQQPRNQRLVYFSSLSIFYSQTRYANHKREMEELVRSTFPQYTIVRLGNITWGENPRTLINFMRLKKQKNEKYVAPAGYKYRYIVNKGEFLHWIKLIPEWNCEINVPGERLTFKEIFQKYAKTPFGYSK